MFVRGTSYALENVRLIFSLVRVISYWRDALRNPIRTAYVFVAIDNA